MLKAPVKNNAKGLKIQDGIKPEKHTRNGSTNISELSNESASEHQLKTVWLFDEDSVQKLRLPNRSKKATKSFDNCDSILDDQSNGQATDPFQMAAEHSDVTASLFLFTDEVNSQDDSSLSSHHHQHLNFPEVSQFSPCNKK